jgi:hypothetical protein
VIPFTVVMCAHGQPVPIIIAQPEALPPQLTSKDSMLFNQIRSGPPVAVDPTSATRSSRSENHGGRVYLTI